MEIFLLLYEMGKKQRKSKERPLHKGRFSYSCVLLRFGNNPHAHVVKCPSLKRTCSYDGNFPYNKGAGNTILVLKAPYSHIILFTKCAMTMRRTQPFHF
jgi:hypothetical protein